MFPIFPFFAKPNPDMCRPTSQVTVRAHKSEITHMVGNCTTMVTASDVGTIRMWHAADFARELHLAGLMPLMSKRDSSSSYGFTQHKGSASSGG